MQSWQMTTSLMADKHFHGGSIAFSVKSLQQARYNPAPHLLKDEALARVASCDEDDDCPPEDVLTQSASLHGAAADLVLQAQASRGQCTGGATAVYTALQQGDVGLGQ